MVTACNSSLQPGERRQGTVAAGQQESLGSHCSGRRRIAPGPRTFCFRAWQGEGSGRQRASLRVGQALGEAGQGAAGWAGPLRPPSDPAGAPGPATGPRPAWTGRRAGPLAPCRRQVPAPDSPRARCLLQSRGRCPSQRRAQPTPPAASAREGKERQGGSDNGNRPMGSPEGLGGVARPRFRVGCTVRAPGRGLEGSAAAFLHCGEQLTCRGAGAGTPGRV